MKSIYLIRHGTRVDRSEGTELNELGIQQAQQTALYFKDKNITGIYASPLKRSQQTAKIISDQLQLPVLTDKRLEERMIYDGSAGDTFEEFLVEWDNTMGNRNYQPIYGDTAYNAGVRLQSLLDELPADGNYIIVSHGGIIGDLLRNLFTDTPLTFKTDPIKSLSWVVISECSITELKKETDQYKLVRVNDTQHLKNAGII